VVTKIVTELTKTPFELKRPDGCVLRGFDYAAPSAAAASTASRGRFVIVHGLGEHQGRYLNVIEFLLAHDFALTTYDVRGHGTSDGPRGGLPQDDALVQDARAIIARVTEVDGTKPYVLGHSLGGLTVASLITRTPQLVRAAVLSSPALALWLNPLQKFLVATLPKIAPNLRVDNGLKIDGLSHDLAVVATYKKDPLVHRKAAARLVAWMVREQAYVYAQAAQLAVPTLLIWAENDQLVHPHGSQMYAAAANHGLLTARQIGGAYHEVFNEGPPFKAHALRNLDEWLTKALPA
jgi:alpha-beta hydrolase superfamily lysophospholipase